LLNKFRVLSEHGPFREQEWILAVIYHTQTVAYPARQYKLMAVTSFFVLYLLYVAESVSPGFKTTAYLRGTTQNFREFEYTAQTVSTKNLRR
jgi:hypothetical protein